MGCNQSTPGRNHDKEEVGGSLKEMALLPPHSRKHSFQSIYDVGSLLGEGAFAQVKAAMHKNLNRAVAVKIVLKRELGQDQEEQLQKEIKTLSELDNPNIMKFYEAYHEPLYYYIVTELLEGGELFDRISFKKNYNEMDARSVCKVLFEAMAYCHSKNIAHRDLKPENILLVSKNNDLDIKIADFGFATKAKSDKCLDTFLGTPGFIAPEILRGKRYGTKVDMFALGVIAYILLAGYPPFYHDNLSTLHRMVSRCEFDFVPFKYWGKVSPQAKIFIYNLMVRNPEQRMSASDALKSSWFEKSADEHQFRQINLNANLDRFKQFNAKRKLRQAVLALMAANRFSDQCQSNHRKLDT